MFIDQIEGPVDDRGDLHIQLDGYAGKSLLVMPGE